MFKKKLKKLINFLYNNLIFSINNKIFKSKKNQLKKWQKLYRLFSMTILI